MGFIKSQAGCPVGWRGSSRERGRPLTNGPTDSHAGEPSAVNESAPPVSALAAALPASLALLAGRGNGWRCRSRTFAELSTARGEDLGKGKEVSPQPSCKPAPQWEGLAERGKKAQDSGLRPGVAPVAGPAFSPVPPGTSARVAASSELKGSLGDPIAPPPTHPETGQ